MQECFGAASSKNWSCSHYDCFGDARFWAPKCDEHARASKEQSRRCHAHQRVQLTAGYPAQAHTLPALPPRE